MDDECVLRLGGECFRKVKKLRGTSSLEGFHSHQKSWLGARGTHAQDSGRALLSDGNLRWNRQRNNDVLCEGDKIPTVFQEGLLREAQHLHRHLTSNLLYHAFPSRKEARASAAQYPAGAAKFSAAVQCPVGNTS